MSQKMDTQLDGLKLVYEAPSSIFCGWMLSAASVMLMPIYGSVYESFELITNFSRRFISFKRTQRMSEEEENLPRKNNPKAEVDNQGVFEQNYPDSIVKVGAVHDD
uniref:Uncharacterized protein n=1 Tax=Glossina austeni TaxID=7395 RepID=A0A1A9UE42_GLOAU